MITANEAYEMSNSTVREHLELIEAAIIYAARDRRYEVNIRTYPYCTYFDGGAHYEIAQTVIRTLENKGFKVSPYYQERPFVEVGICIRWSEI